MLLSWDLPCLFSLEQASYLWLHPTPAKMQIRNVTKKENRPKQIVFWSFLLFCPPLLFTDRESENESVKSFPASALFDQIKLCVLFDWNWIVVKGQGGGEISEVRVLLQYLILNQHSLIKDKEKNLYPNREIVLNLNTLDILNNIWKRRWNMMVDIWQILKKGGHRSLWGSH